MRPWTFPVGTGLLKAFARPPDEGGLLVEVRVMWHASDGWAFRTYAWDGALGDAIREWAQGTEVDDGQADGGHEQQSLEGGEAQAHREEDLGARAPEFVVSFLRADWRNGVRGWLGCLGTGAGDGEKAEKGERPAGGFMSDHP